jgi:hypothetical protein
MLLVTTAVKQAIIPVSVEPKERLSRNTLQPKVIPIVPIPLKQNPEDTKEMETRAEDLLEVDTNLLEVMVQECPEAQETAEDLQILEDLKDPETQVLLLKDQLEESIALIQDSHRQQQVDVAAEVQILKEDLIE